MKILNVLDNLAQIKDNYKGQIFKLGEFTYKLHYTYRYLKENQQIKILNVLEKLAQIRYDYNKQIDDLGNFIYNLSN